MITQRKTIGRVTITVEGMRETFRWSTNPLYRLRLEWQLLKRRWRDAWQDR